MKIPPPLGLTPAIGVAMLLLACGSDDSASTYIFDLSESELLALHPMVEDQHSPTEWLEMHKAPFDCERYGELCTVVGPNAAETIVRDGLLRGLAGEAKVDIETAVEQAIEVAMQDWSASVTIPRSHASHTLYVVTKRPGVTASKTSETRPDSALPEGQTTSQASAACFLPPNPVTASETRTRTRCTSSEAERDAISAAQTAVEARCDEILSDDDLTADATCSSIDHTPTVTFTRSNDRRCGMWPSRHPDWSATVTRGGQCGYLDEWGWQRDMRD